MDIVVKVVIVLTVATVAAPKPADKISTVKFQLPVVNPGEKPSERKLSVVDPQDFKELYKTHNGRLFSKTTPHVDLTHTFCGEVKQGEAQGFHSQYVVDKNSAQPCARIIGKITGDNPEKRPYSADKIEVRNSNGKYKLREARERRPLTFFPKHWGPPFIVKLAQAIYNQCKGNSMLIDGTACLKNYKFPDSEVYPPTMNIKINVQDGIIKSAYPTKNVYGCDHNCTFSESDYPLPSAAAKNRQDL